MPTSEKQTYAYKKGASILFGLESEYKLSDREFVILYSFFVTYSCCASQSFKKRTLKDYGWAEFARKTNNKNVNKSVYLKDALTEIIDLDDRNFFVFSEKNDLKKQFQDHDLNDAPLTEFNTERAVLAKTSSESNHFLKLFYRLRNGFAHGNFALRFNSKEEKMIIIQDNDGRNVTARIVLKLETLLKIIRIIDKNNLIMKENEQIEHGLIKELAMSTTI